MKIQIKHKYGQILFERECESIKILICELVKEKSDLRGAYLRGADLRGAYLQGAYLQGAALQGVDLRGADLRGADLQGAYLQGANLQGVDLQGAYLQGANLRGAKDFDNSTLKILPEGDLIGYKKCQNNVIVKLLIPSDVKRSNSTGRKCRAESVKVLEILNKSIRKDGSFCNEAISKHDGVTSYKEGEIVKCDKWDEDWANECSGGIHFFITRKEAEDY